MVIRMLCVSVSNLSVYLQVVEYIGVMDNIISAIMDYDNVKCEYILYWYVW